MIGEFYEEAFPLLIYSSPESIDDAAIERLHESLEAVWRRRQRYAFITHRSERLRAATAAERKRLAEWAGRDEVRSRATRYCVGAATVVPDRVARGAMTALLWLWRPGFPLEPVASIDEAVEYCLGKLEAANVPVDRGSDATRDLVRRLLASDRRTG